MITIKALALVIHIGRSQKLTLNQNQSKSLPAQMHGRQKRCGKLKEKMTEDKEHPDGKISYQDFLD